MLKLDAGLASFEVIAIDLTPVIDAAIFEVACLTTDCTPLDAS